MRKNNFGDLCKYWKQLLLLVLLLGFAPVNASSEFKPTGNALYNVSSGSNENYSYFTSTYDKQNGGLITKFYKVDLNVDSLTKSNDVVYSIVEQPDENSLSILWFNAPLYLNYSISVAPVDSILEIVTDDTFIDGVFTGALSGVILNSASNITVDAEFLNNYSDTGSAVLSNSGSVYSITSNFIGNYSAVDGAVIRNDGQIDYINSVFMGNYSLQNGGVIRNDNVIKRINSDFVGNYALSAGGVIYNNADIDSITSNFVSNYSTGSGGAIYNSTGGIIDTIESTFINNYSQAGGGAIYNTGKINTIRNSSFLGNYSSGVDGNRGGAIYTNSNITFVAEGGVIEFSGNYVLSESGAKDSEAIFVQNDRLVTLTFDIKDGGEVILNDKIDGTYGYLVEIKGVNPQNDRFRLYNSINNAYVDAENVRLDLLNGEAFEYQFISSSFNNVLLDFDVVLDKVTGALKSDVIKLDEYSHGVLTLDNVNYSGVDIKTIIDNHWTVKLLDTASSQITLELSDRLKSEIAKVVGDLNLAPERVSEMDLEVPANAKWSDVLDPVYYTYGTKNPYIGITDDKKSFGFIYNYNTTTEMLYDSLVIMNRAAIDTKTFSTDSADTYFLTYDLGETEGNFTVRGLSSTDSVIDLAGYDGFELISGSVLNLENVKLSGNNTLITSKSHQAKLNLKDSYLDGDIIGFGKFAINISGEDITTINGKITDAVVTLNKGDLAFNPDTFSDESVSLHAEGGVINLVDNAVNSYNISELISSKSVDYSMDLQVVNSAGDITLNADTWNVGRYSLGGAIKINSINFVDELDSLKLNNNVKDVISKIQTTDGTVITVDSLDCVSNVVDESFKQLILSKYDSAVDCISAGVKVLFSDFVGDESNNLTLGISDNANNKEVFVTGYYNRTDSFDAYKTDNTYSFKSTDEMFDNTYVTAFYRDVLLDESLRGLSYIIKSLEVKDTEKSVSMGAILKLMLELNVGAGEDRVFTLVSNYTLDTDSVINVTAGKIDITSKDLNHVLNFNDKEVVLNNNTQLNLSDIKVTGMNLNIASSDANVELNNVYLGGALKSDIEGAKVIVVGDKTTTLATQIEGVTVQLGGDSSDKVFKGVLNINPEKANNFDMVIGANSEGVVELNNGTTELYRFNSLNIDENSNTTFGVDVILDSNNFSSIDIAAINDGLKIDISDSRLIYSDIIAAETGEGTIRLSDINVKDSLNSLVNYIARNLVIDEKINPEFEFNVDIIASNIGNNNLNLALVDELAGNKFSLTTTTVGGSNDIIVRPVTSWTESFSYVVTEWFYELSINGDNQLHFDISSNMSKQQELDTLYYVNAYDKIPTKEFVTTDANELYKVDLSTIPLDDFDTHPVSMGVTKGNMVIRGAIGQNSNGEEIRSTIDFDNKYGGFTIVDNKDDEIRVPQKFEFDSVDIRSAYIDGNGSLLNVLASDSQIIFKDVIIENNNSTGLGGAVYTKSDISIYAINADSVFKGNMQNAAQTSQPDLNFNDIYFAKNFEEDGEQNLNLNASTGHVVSLASGIDFDKDTRLVLNINTGYEKDYDGTVSIKGSIGSKDKPLAAININGGTFNVSNGTTSIYTDNLSITKNTLYNFAIDMDNYTNDKIVVLDHKRLIPNEVFNDDISLGYTTFILNKDSMDIKLNSPLRYNKVQVIDMIGETSKFIRLAYDSTDEEGNTVTNYIDDLTTGIKVDTGLDNYYVRLGLNGKLIIYNDDKTLNNDSADLLEKIDTFSKKAVSYKLTTNKIIYDYDNNSSSDGLNTVLRHKELQALKLTITGDTISTISTPVSMEGITLKGVAETDEYGVTTFSIVPNKQQFIGKNFTMTGFDGAVRNNGGKVTLTNVNFLGNETEGNGSAIQNNIYVLNDIKYKGSVTLKGSSKKYVKVNSNLSTYDGGAIYNEGTLTLKYVEFGSEDGLYNHALNGGAVANFETEYFPISANISAVRFYNNIADNKGGAIYTTGLLKTSKNTFDNNSARLGGAVYVGANNIKTSAVTMTSDTFTNNGAVNGGALYVGEGMVTVSKANFGTAKYDLENDVKVKTGNKAENGGAVYNAARVDGATKTTVKSSKFYNNTAKQGGAVYNDENAVLALSKNTFGGAVKTREKVDGKTTTVTRYYYNEAEEDGGVIYNKGTVTDSGSSYGYNIALNGGAIFNDSRMVGTKVQKKVETDVAGLNSVKFTGNKAEIGGAVYNSVNGYLWSNKNTFTSNEAEIGGAAYNVGDMNMTSSTFASNVANVMGGAIYNDAKLQLNSSTLYANSALEGGAVYNSGTGVLTINKGTFGKKDTKKAQNSNHADTGGGIYNEGELTTTSVNFTNNSANNGGAIYNDGKTNVIRTTFSTNKAEVSGGAIYNNNNTADETKVQGSSFSKNNALAGGAIYNNGNLDVDRYDYVTVSKNKEKHKYYNNSFTSNTANNGGAIYNAGTLHVGYATFKTNKATENGGALYLADNTTTTIDNATFTSNSAQKGGAIYVGKSANLTINDSTFSKNTATEQGAAIYMDEGSNVTINAILKDVTFSGNKVGKTANSIYMGDNSVLNLVAADGRKITIKDAIVAETTATINIASTGTVSIVNEDALRTQNVTINRDATISTQNNRTTVTRFASLNVQDKANIQIDASLKNKTSDKIQADTVTGEGTLNVSSVNIVTNSKTPVTINVGKDSIVSSISAKTAESAEATYKLKSYYDENGLLRVVAYGQKAKPSAVAAPVAAQIGGYLTQINSYDQAFMNMDMNMLVPRSEREAMQQTYSCENKDGIEYNGKGLWNRPYATFERVNLNNGPKVNNIGYGNYFGGDADMKQLNNGWRRQFSAYVGYNGSVQDYDRQSIDQNGGTVGVTEVWYKNNFFTGLTLNAGANVAQASTDLGRENMPMFMTGIASKTGYNFEFKECKFIVQPSLLLSYSFIHTFAHDNGLGHRVSSSPLNAIQVAPGIKFIANLKNGWQPYFNVNMRWNIIDKTHFALQDVTIPDMSIDPYVEYGLGLQRRWGERFTGFGQAMIRNGGRNGVMLSFGFKWLLGR